MLKTSNNKEIKIVESGTNGNGSYIKFENGDMICRQKIEKNAPIKGTFGQGFYGGAESLPNFPIEFVDCPIVSIAIESAQAISAVPYGITKESVNFCYLYSFSSYDNAKVIINIIAIGKWK